MCVINTCTADDGRILSAYPDLPWEPKRAFSAVASFYASH